MFLIFLSAVMAVTPPQQGPPISAHHLQPTDGRIEASYACAGRDPEIRTTYTLELEYERVRIAAYSGANGEANPEDLAQWNAWLEPIRAIQVHRFDCRGDSETLIIEGIDRNGEGVSGVIVTWRNGEMQGLPVRYDDE